MKTYNPTWYERATNPDLITRGLNVGSGPATYPPTEDAPYSPGPVQPWLTQPGMRPTVLQRFIPLPVIATTPATPVSNGRLEAIGVIFNVYSTALASAFWGPAGVTATSGIEIRPGFPEYFFVDQTREEWELQRTLEHIGAMISQATGNTIMGPYMAPRVIIDLSQVFIASVAAQTVSCIAFLPPEQQ